MSGSRKEGGSNPARGVVGRVGIGDWGWDWGWDWDGEGRQVDSNGSEGDVGREY